MLRESQATKDSVFCKSLTVGDTLNPSLKLKRKNKYLTVENGSVTYPKKYRFEEDWIDCEYERRPVQSNVDFIIKGYAKSYRSITIAQKGGDSTRAQVISCKEVLSGPRINEPYISCVGDIAIDESDGKALVKVILN